MTEGWAAIPNWMVRDPQVKPNTLAVYAVLQSHAGVSGTTALRHKTIATEAGVSVDTVKRATKVLNELGVLWWEGTTRGDGYGSNVYHPLQERHEGLVGMHHSPHPARSTKRDSAPTPVQDAAPTQDAESAGSSRSSGQNVRSPAPTPVQDAAPTPVQNGRVGAVSTQVGAVSTTKEEESFEEEPPPTSPGSDGFQEFWAAYPPGPYKGKIKDCRALWASMALDERRDAWRALMVYRDSKDWDENGAGSPLRWLENEPWLEYRAGNRPKPKPKPKKYLTPEDVRLPD